MTEEFKFEFDPCGTPWAHQIEAYKKFSPLRNGALFFEPGCLAADTVVRISRGGLSRKYTLEKLYRSFNKVELSRDSRGFTAKYPTYIRSMLDGRIGLNEIKNVIRSGVKELFEIKVKGLRKKLKATGDHEIFTERGWIRADSLVPKADKVAIDTLVRHQKKAKKEKQVKTRYRTTTVDLCHPYARYKRASTAPVKYTNRFGVVSVKRYKKKPIKEIEQHRLIMEADINGFHDMASFKKHLKEKGSDGLYFIDPNEFHVHHKDNDSYNNDVTNLEILSRKNHYQHHGDYGRFGHGEIQFAEVESVKPCGLGMTYDIVCYDPYRNFVADNIVVHNCGKTFTSILLARQKMFLAHKTLRVLVVCPPIVIQNWVNEWKTRSLVHHDMILPLVGSGREREWLMANKGGLAKVIITNYQSLSIMPKVFKALCEWRPQILIADEVHRVKDPKTKVCKATAAIAELTKHNFILTGTPVLNSPMDIFGQYLVMDGGATFGKNFYSFRNKYFYNRMANVPHVKFQKWEPVKGAKAEIARKIAWTSMHVKKEECLDLPPLVKEVLEVELSSEQMKLYREMAKDYITYIDGRAAVARIALTKILRLLQITTGFISVEGDDGEAREVRGIKDNPRLEVLGELLEGLTPSGKVIVWCSFKHNYTQVRELCKTLDLCSVEITGEISQKEKDKNLERFRSDDECRVLIGNQGSGGIGINLVESPYSIFYSRTFSLEHDIQAEARNYRAGSEMHKKVTRYDLIAKGTVDELVYQKLAGKEAMSKEILEQIADNLRGRL